MNAWLGRVCRSVALLMLAALVSAPAVHGGTVHEEFDFVQEPIYISCIDEEVAGILHISLVFHERSSANGGYHITSNARQQGTVVGLTSGIEWSCKGVSNAKLNTQSDQASIRLLAPVTCSASGQAPLLDYNFRWVMTWANGELRTEHSIESLTCKGRRN